jgi:hypothetical protein
MLHDYGVKLRRGSKAQMKFMLGSLGEPHLEAIELTQFVLQKKTLWTSKPRFFVREDVAEMQYGLSPAIVWR